MDLKQYSIFLLASIQPSDTDIVMIPLKQLELKEPKELKAPVEIITNTDVDVNEIVILDSTTVGNR